MTDTLTTDAPSIVAANFDLPLLSALFDMIPDRVVIVSPENRYLFVNRAALEFLGRDADHAIGQTAAEILGPAYVEKFRPVLERVRTGSTVRWQAWVDYPNGKRHFVENTFAPCCSADCAPVATICIMRDLTELKLREEELAQKSAALAASESINTEIIRSALDPIVVTDDKGIVLDFNPAAEHVFGYERLAVMGRSVAELIVPPDKRAAHQHGMERYTRTGQSHILGRRLEMEAIDASGKTIPVELTVNEVRLPDRRLFTAHLRDLRAAHKAAAEIERQKERIHQVEKLSAMGSLLAGVAHELNNPLAILLAQSTLLTDTAGDEGVRRRAERIHAAAERAGRIIKSFLAMARQKPPSRERIDLNTLVRDTLEVVAYGLRSSGVSVVTEFDASLPQLMLDQDLFRQVIANLVINAQQALGQQPQPRLLTIRTYRAAEFVGLEVEDNGPGVPKELAERIFDPFFTTKPAGVGTGIGLAICNDVVKAHGGRLELGDRKDGGALFRVLVPLAAEHQASVPPDALVGNVRGERVLVVDDEIDVGESLAEMLALIGHRVEISASAQEALARIETEPYTRVFVDLRMPEMNGDAFIEKLAASRPALAARTVLMTGDTVRGPASMAGLKVVGLAPLILEKPFSLDDVRRVIEQSDSR
jgi:PAS domain S-box-containing protein